MPPSKAAARTPLPVVAKIDFRKSHPELYRTGRQVEEVRPPKGTFLAVDGIGEPGGGAFQHAVRDLFTLVYATKFAMKKAGGSDFAIPPLECLWFDDPSATPRHRWRWRVMLRVPPCVSPQGLRMVRKMLAGKNKPAAEAVKRVAWAEGRALQVLHVGPYDSVGAAYRKLGEEAAARGLRCAGPGHETYLSDPRRVAPERIRTLVRMAVRR